MGGRGRHNTEGPAGRGQEAGSALLLEEISIVDSRYSLLNIFDSLLCCKVFGAGNVPLAKPNITIWGPPRGLLHENRVEERVYAMGIVGAVEKLEGACGRTCGANLWGKPGLGQEKKKKEKKRKPVLQHRQISICSCKSAHL